MRPAPESFSIPLRSGDARVNACSNPFPLKRCARNHPIERMARSRSRSDGVMPGHYLPGSPHSPFAGHCSPVYRMAAILVQAAREAMRIVVLLMALVIIVMGVVGVVAPDTVMAMRREYVATPRGIYIVGAIRLALGFLLILVAP